MRHAILITPLLATLLATPALAAPCADPGASYPVGTVTLHKDWAAARAASATTATQAPTSPLVFKKANQYAVIVPRGDGAFWEITALGAANPRGQFEDISKDCAASAELQVTVHGGKLVQLTHAVTDANRMTEQNECVGSRTTTRDTIVDVKTGAIVTFGGVDVPGPFDRDSATRATLQGDTLRLRYAEDLPAPRALTLKALNACALPLDTTPAAAAATWLKRARAAQTSKAYEDASALFRIALAHDAQNPALLSEAGYNEVLRGKYYDADALLTEALKHKPDAKTASQIHYNLGVNKLNYSAKIKVPEYKKTECARAAEHLEKANTLRPSKAAADKLALAKTCP